MSPASKDAEISPGATAWVEVFDLVRALQHDALGVLNDAELAFPHPPVGMELRSENAKDGHDQFFLEDRCSLSFLPEAFGVVSSLWPCAETMAADAAFVQCLEKVRRV